MTDKHPLDLNGDGEVSDVEMQMHLEFKRKELEDADAQRDAMRKMTWFALAGLLFYPSGIFLTSELIADVAPTYFVAIAALVSAFFGADAIKKK